MSGGYGEKNSVDDRLIDRLVESGRSVEKSVRKFLGFEKKSADEVVKELFSAAELDVSNMEKAVTQEVEKLREKLESATPNSFSRDEAALLLYSHITEEMESAREKYEKLSNRSSEKKRQKAETFLSRMSVLSEVSEVLESDFSFKASSPSRELLLMEDGQDFRAMTDGGQRAQTAAHKRLEELREENTSLRKYTNKRKNMRY